MHLPRISNNSYRSSSMNSKGKYSVPSSTPKSIGSWKSKEIELKTPDELRYMLKKERIVKFM